MAPVPSESCHEQLTFKAQRARAAGNGFHLVYRREGRIGSSSTVTDALVKGVTLEQAAVLARRGAIGSPAET